MRGSYWILFHQRTYLQLFTLLWTGIHSTAGCGSFIDIQSSSETGSISSPFYPSSYGHRQVCIWFISAPKEYAVVLNIPSVDGQLDATTGDCLDYLEVRNGSSAQTQEYLECSTTTAATVQSSSRWLWIKFRSDDTVANSGFTATYSVTSSPGNSDDGSPVLECDAVQHRCPNKECISWAYKCDGAEDCGCSTSGCDEIGCGPLGWSGLSRIWFGIGVGSAIFCFMFFGIGILDIYLKKRAATKYRLEMEQRQKLAKKKRALAAVESMFHETRLDVSGTGSHSAISRQSSWSKSSQQAAPHSPTVAVKIN